MTRLARFTVPGMPAVALLCALCLLPAPESRTRRQPRPFAQSDPKSGVAGLHERLPPHFVPNQGQFGPEILFSGKTRDRTVRFVRDGFVTQIRAPGAAVDPGSLRAQFLGASRSVRVLGQRPLAGKVSYILGADPTRWRQGIPTFGEIVYLGLYHKVDLSFSGSGPDLESTFRLRPGGRIGDIRIRYHGAGSMALDPQGNLIVGAGGMTVQESKPRAFQYVGDTRVEVAVRFRLEGKARTFGFRLDSSYDPARDLYIDPILAFSSYLGGSGLDLGTGIAVDNSGQIYIAGTTRSPNLPTQSPFRNSPGGKGDAFVTKISSDGSTLLYSTYLGGSEEDEAGAIAVDPASGQVCLTGVTFSNDFPTHAAYRASNSGRGDVFVTKLSRTGQSLDYSTYFGGGDFDAGLAIAMDAGGSVYLAGQTSSSDLPRQNSFQSSLRGIQDAFVAKLAAGGQTLLYSTYLGGSDTDRANAVSVDASGQAYVTGYTASLNFPTQAPFQGESAGGRDAFLAKVSSSGSSLIYATYLGGSDDEEGAALALDASGGAYVTGSTRSPDFPAVNAFQPLRIGGSDIFLCRFSPAGSSLSLSTYIGGSGEEAGLAVARDASGRIYIAGETSSADFPVANALQPSLSGARDAFILQLASNGTSLLFSTYLGGTGIDSAFGMAVDPAGSVYLAGETRSPDFPIRAARQGSPGGGGDAFYLRVDPLEPTFVTSLLFPRLVSHDGGPDGPEASEYTGIAVANLSGADATIRFSAYDGMGELLGGAGVSNPAQLTLAGRNQLAVVGTQLFGSGLTARRTPAWIRMESTVAGTVGFFLTFNSTLEVLDGADVSPRTLTRFVFPEVEDAGFTEIHLANPGAGPAAVTLELADAEGNVSVTASREVRGNGVLAESLSSLFPSISTFSGEMHIRGTASRPVVAFEYLGKTGKYVEGLNGQDPGSGARKVYSPQYAVGGPWRTTLSVLSFGDVPATLLLKLIGDAGAVLATRIVPLPPRGKYLVRDQAFFVTPNPDLVTQGYVEITSDNVDIGGAVVFGDPERSRFSSALPLAPATMTTAVFSQLASDTTYFTGLAVLNPGAADTSFLLEVFDKAGTPVASRNVPLSAQRRSSQLLTQHFPSLPAISSGYFRVSSTQGLVSFALFGTGGLTVLSAIPPQSAGAAP